MSDTLQSIWSRFLRTADLSESQSEIARVVFGEIEKLMLEQRIETAGLKGELLGLLKGMIDVYDLPSSVIGKFSTRILQLENDDITIQGDHE